MRSLLALSVLLFASAARADGPALEYTLAPGGIRITTGGSARELPIPDCEPKAIAREGTRVIVACGASGLAILDATDPKSPTIASRVPTDGEAVALPTVGGKVWVDLAHHEVRPVEPLLRASRPIDGDAAPAATAGATPIWQAAPQSGSNERSRTAPPRHGDIWELDVGTHLFLAIGDIGFGALNRGSLTYRFAAPVSIRAELAPAGVGLGKRGTIGTAAAHAVVALDTHLFEAGLGVGAATNNDPSGTAETSVSIAERARIGARDGLNMTLTSNIIIDRDRFTVGAVAIEGQAPVGSRFWLLLRGGGGPIGYGYGDIGVRYLAAGDLGPGSVFVTGTAGGAAILKDRACVYPSCTSNLSATYAGPAVGLGLELRF